MVSKDMMVSIIVPCYNEISTISEVVSRVLESKLSIAKELIIVDDGSTDGTRDFLTALNGHQVSVVFHRENLGKGAAVRTGILQAKGDIVLIQDADLEYNPTDYPKLIQPILDGKADVVYGSRFVGGETHRVLYFWHSLGNRLLTFLSNSFTNLNLSDMEVGYKAFRREIFHQITIEESGFGLEPEITAKIARLNCRIYEVGIAYFGRTYAEGKKINWKDGLRAVYIILKYGLFRK